MQRAAFWAFFTLQSGMVGRLVPSTGVMRIVTTPSEGTYPYGIQINSKNEPWYVDFRGNRIGRANPETMAITEYELPNADVRPRRLAITPDDAIWYTERARISRPLRPSNRQDSGMGIPKRRELTTVWHRGLREHNLVQRVRRARRHTGEI